MIPAAIIIIFSLSRVNVKISILLSIIAASTISVLMQHSSIIAVIKYLIFGYTIEQGGLLKNIIKGGGLLSMFKTAIVVLISSAFTGIFEETKMLKSIEDIVCKSKGRAGCFLTTIIVSAATSAFGCSQTLAIILTQMLIKEAYKNNKISNNELAVDIENSAIVIAPLIPWNIAVLVPLTTLNTGIDAIIYAFYLYLIPVTNLVYQRFKTNYSSANN